MNLLGLSLYTDANSMIPLPPRHNSFTYTRLENGAFDELLFCTNVVQFGQTIKSEWDNYTILHAKFDNDLRGGNLEYRADTVSTVRVKRRERGENGSWITLKEFPIKETSDFTFTYVDRYARARTEYEYAVVPLINNVEMNYTIGTVYSDFDGIIICDSNESYQTVADESIQTVTRRNPASIIEPLDSVYPYVIHNGNTNYDTGTVQGLFVEIDWDKKIFKTKSSFMLRDTVMHFLSNGQPKILKSFDGRIWMVDITSDPTATVQNHPDQVSISFNFTEIGDTYSTTDMYNNGLTDINREGS